MSIYNVEKYIYTFLYSCNYNVIDDIINILNDLGAA